MKTKKEILSFEPANIRDDKAGQVEFLSLLTNNKSSDDDSYFLQLGEGIDKKKKQCNYSNKRLKSAIDTKNIKAVGCNVFVSVNSFAPNTSRKAFNLSSFNGNFVDIDYYKKQWLKEKRPEQVAQYVVDICLATKLPKPTAIVASGHGIQVFWLYPKAAEPGYKNVWDTIQKELLKTFEKLGADSLSLDSSRVVRVPGTYNTKDSNNPIKVRLLNSGLNSVAQKGEKEWNTYKTADYDYYHEYDEGQTSSDTWVNHEIGKYTAFQTLYNWAKNRYESRYYQAVAKKNGLKGIPSYQIKSLIEQGRVAAEDMVPFIAFEPNAKVFESALKKREPQRKKRNINNLSDEDRHNQHVVNALMVSIRRKEDLDTVQALREGNMTGMREVFLFYYDYFLRTSANHEERKLEHRRKALYEANSKFTEPLDKKEIDEKILFGNSLAITPSNDTLVFRLAITVEEQMILKTICSEEIQKLKRAARENKSKKVNADRMQIILEKIITYRIKGMSMSEIAKAIHVHKNTVFNYMKKHRVDELVANICKDIEDENKAAEEKAKKNAAGTGNDSKLSNDAIGIRHSKGTLDSKKIEHKAKKEARKEFTKKKKKVSGNNKTAEKEQPTQAKIKKGKLLNNILQYIVSVLGLSNSKKEAEKILNEAITKIINPYPTEHLKEDTIRNKKRIPADFNVNLASELSAFSGWNKGLHEKSVNIALSAV